MLLLQALGWWWPAQWHLGPQRAKVPVLIVTLSAAGFTPASCLLARYMRMFVLCMGQHTRPAIAERCGHHLPLARANGNTGRPGGMHSKLRTRKLQACLWCRSCCLCVVVHAASWGMCVPADQQPMHLPVLFTSLPFH